LTVPPGIIGIKHQHGEEVVVSLSAELEKLAEAAVADWPEISFSGQFEAQIRDLYRTHLRFPPSWSQDECDEFITSNADMDAIRLTTKFDDVIDTVIDRYERQHWTRPHHDDAEEMIDTERRAAIDELEFHIEALSDELATMTIHSLGRADASMTGCSPTHRRSQGAIKPTRRRRHPRH
jgi:hypothetical protein